MWKFTPIPLADAFVIDLPAFYDDRGSFVKTFHETTLAQYGISFDLKESYFSLSKKESS